MSKRTTLVFDSRKAVNAADPNHTKFATFNIGSNIKVSSMALQYFATSNPFSSPATFDALYITLDKVSFRQNPLMEGCQVTKLNSRHFVIPYRTADTEIVREFGDFEQVVSVNQDVRIEYMFTVSIEHETASLPSPPLPGEWILVLSVCLNGCD